MLTFSLISSSLVATALAVAHDVQVGSEGASYTPNLTIAAVGDTVTFHFFPGHHDVAQGTFSKPCTPLEGGFYSGFIVPTSGEADEVFTITINDTNPIWYYCSSYMHCQYGMGAVINPPFSGDTLQAYLAAAHSTSNSTAPSAVMGGVFSTRSNSTSTATETACRTAATSSASATSSTSNGVVVGARSATMNGIAAAIALSLFWAGMV